jgi:hypothetical protein
VGSVFLLHYFLRELTFYTDMLSYFDSMMKITLLIALVVGLFRLPGWVLTTFLSEKVSDRIVVALQRLVGLAFGDIQRRRRLLQQPSLFEEAQSWVLSCFWTPQQPGQPQPIADGQAQPQAAQPTDDQAQPQAAQLAVDLHDQAQ